MNPSIIKRFEIVLDLELENEKISKSLFETLNLESTYNPNERAQASLEVENNVLRLKIDALDTISARATVNSFLKWINLSIQLINQMEEK